VAVFWVVAPCDRPDDGGSKDLRNVGKLLPVFTALQPRRQPSYDHLIPRTDFNVRIRNKPMGNLILNGNKRLNESG
jgi:hypothetical protein